MLCLTCGAGLVLAKGGRYVHTEATPNFHDAQPGTRDELLASMALEHGPREVSDALELAARTRTRMRDPAMDGVQWTPEARALVVLLGELEEHGPAH